MSGRLADREAGGGLLGVRHLRKVYGIGRTESKVAVEDVTFEVQEGEFVSVVGPSGAGKTTVLRCMAGLTRPSGGEVRLGGDPVERVSPQVGVVFQDYSRSLFPWLSVAKNVALPLRVRGVDKKVQGQRVQEVLASVGLSDVGGRYPWQLSGGMQQRVAIARCLVYRPSLLFMDEPFASVDAQTRFELEDLILNVRREFGITVVFVTHDIDEAVYVADRVVVLSASPSVVRKVVEVGLGPERNQVGTKADPRFTELRGEILGLVMA